MTPFEEKLLEAFESSNKSNAQEKLAILLSAYKKVVVSEDDASLLTDYGCPLVLSYVSNQCVLSKNNTFVVFMRGMFRGSHATCVRNFTQMQERLFHEQLLYGSVVDSDRLSVVVDFSNVNMSSLPPLTFLRYLTLHPQLAEVYVVGVSRIVYGMLLPLKSFFQSLKFTMCRDFDHLQELLFHTKSDMLAEWGGELEFDLNSYRAYQRRLTSRTFPWYEEDNA